MLINLIFALIAGVALVAFGITLNHLRTERRLNDRLFENNFELNERNLNLSEKLKRFKKLAFEQRQTFNRTTFQLRREKSEVLALLEMVLDDGVCAFDRPSLSRDKFRRDFVPG